MNSNNAGSADPFGICCSRPQYGDPDDRRRPLRLPQRVQALSMKRLMLTAILVTAMGAPTRTSELASLSRATEWINSPPLTAEGLQGRVVLVQFWTYSCINWLRTMPYVRSWAEKYRDRGLVVIGVHSPEFGFEHNVDNVRWAAKELDVKYPIAVDNQYAIWGGFDNQYWPALYFVDAKGRVRHHQFGEGSYEESEKIIQELLAEAGHGSADGALVSVEGRGAEAAADWRSLRSPENYVGYE